MEYRILVVGWGSTYHVIKEALGNIDRKDVSFLHFKQVYPLHKDTVTYLRKAETVVMVENNATSQFGMLIKLHLGYEIKDKILQYNGLPFSVETIKKQINRILRRD